MEAKDIAFDLIEHTDRSVFLTGKAGTGKTTFLRDLKEKSSKRMVVVAPTGVAAINAGGVTIHSFFQLPPSLFIPGITLREQNKFSKEKRRIIRSMDLLVIDEISMVRCDLLDAIDSVLRRYRFSSRPFGGVQLLMIGDLQQLTPVVTSAEEPLLREHYETPYFFGSKALANVPYVTVELTHVYRQQDRKFINILNAIRDSKATPADYEVLNSRCRPDFTPSDDEGYIRLSTHNTQADNYNSRRLDELKTKTHTYTAKIQKDFPEYNYPTSFELKLKVGAQVMFIKNDTSPEHLYYNGKIGHVTKLTDSVVFVKCVGEDEAIEVVPQDWENIKYEINGDSKEIEPVVQGLFSQYPLRLAWAITIHKSQGLTFDKAIIDAQFSFASGQVYVALSRCRSLEGLVLASPIGARSVFQDSSVGAFISRERENAAGLEGNLPLLKREYGRTLLLEVFSFSEIGGPLLRLRRTVVENFKRHKEAIEMLDKACDEYGVKIKAVADKWNSYIAAIPIDKLEDSSVAGRISPGAGYFSKELEKLVPPALDACRTLSSEDKALMRRVGNVFEELKVADRLKRLVLERVAGDGFSVEKYLEYRKDAVLEVMDGAKPAKKKKAPKEDTREVSFRMYRDGKEVKEIAEERKLTEQTIIGHLAIYVAKGEVDPRDFITVKKRNAVWKVLEEEGAEAHISAIKAKCPEDITYTDIRFALAEKLRDI